MSQRLIMKFGGTSVGGPEAIQRTAALVQRSRDVGHQVVVVVSAMRGVTDALIDAATAAAAGNVSAAERARQFLWERHHEAASLLLPDGALSVLGDIEAELSAFANLTSAISVLGELTPRALDFIASLGERFNARLVAATLAAQGCPAEAIMADEIIVTDTHFGNATPLLGPTGERSRARLEPLLAAGVVPVVTGFMGATEAGIVTTLGRGGSDYTGAILGHALDADEVWIWSDVDGVLTADPRLVPDAHPIAHLSYKEAAELAYFGAKVLHPRTVRPVIEKGIPLRMLNTFNPDHEGTLVTAQPTRDGAVKAVTSIPHLALVTLEGRGMLGVPGVAARCFGAVAQSGVNVLMISQGSSEQSICFVVRQDDAAQTVASLQRAFSAELAQGDIERVWEEGNVTIIAIVGAAMRGTPGIAGRLFTALGQGGVNVLAIAQGSSEHNVSIVVESGDVREALRVIHAAFGLERGGGQESGR